MSFLKKLIGFNSSRYRLKKENEAFAAFVPSGALVLDAGAGDGPYKSLFGHARYESADFEQIEKSYQKSTYICDLKRIPVEDARFDFILFNQVMEHLPEPKLVLTELYRVLKPGGKMIYTGPLSYEEHEQPYDFYRYTQFGLRYLLESSGYNIDRIDWLEGYYGTAGYQLSTLGHYLPYKPSKGIVGYMLVPLMMILKLIFLSCSVLFHNMEKYTKHTTTGYPKNYVALVSK